jgi:hypothetical protein
MVPRMLYIYPGAIMHTMVAAPKKQEGGWRRSWTRKTQ